jgi:bacteriocin biosynthesis cyclodehydratase domain-containing protein
MYAKGLQIIPVSADQFVLKRGVHELLLTGSGVRRIVEPLLGMLDGASTREEILEMFPADSRGDIAQLLTAMVRRGLILESPAPVDMDADEGALERAFFQNFPVADAALNTLRSASVLVVGVNLVSRALVRGLLESGVGRVVLANDPVLDNFLSPLARAGEHAWGIRAPDRLVRIAAMPDRADLKLICATSDFGEADALFEINRMAVDDGVPYLPAWIADLIGHIGPLVYPRETACLRCYRLRADSNDEQYQVKRAIRGFVTVDEGARAAAGLLSPMASIVGEVAAMEVVKSLVEFAPSNVTGRQIQMNLVSFGAAVRRVLKIPRCPDCSEQTRHSPRAITVGPQIANRSAR